jgi:predicted MPP superfamily phosphohydrolase
MATYPELLTLLSAQLAAGGLVWALLRVVVPGGLLRGPRARRLTTALLAADVVLPLLWFVLAHGVNPRLADGLIVWLILLFLGQGTTALVLAPAALLRAGRQWRTQGSGDDPAVDHLRRRVLLRSAALALPLIAVSAGAAGAVQASRTARLRRRTVVLPGLPEALDGLRILHLSDIHLWWFVTLADLEAALAQIPAGEVDLVCLTGDVADDLALLAPALERIAALAPPLGCFACLGNHEQARRLGFALKTFADSPVSLLRTGGRRLRHRDADLYLVGIDDPHGFPGVQRSQFFREQVETVMRPVPEGSFTIALSHRPGVFDAAAAAGIALTLAGHTHGGQAAVFGTSILEIATPERYPWGLYERHGRALHVTCGVGHWFPVRLGCPPELVLLQLRRS